jgi:hypothetical protein
MLLLIVGRRGLLTFLVKDVSFNHSTYFIDCLVLVGVVRTRIQCSQREMTAPQSVKSGPFDNDQTVTINNIKINKKGIKQIGRLRSPCSHYLTAGNPNPSSTSCSKVQLTNDRKNPKKRSNVTLQAFPVSVKIQINPFFEYNE